MNNPLVVISDVHDGSMFNRHDIADPAVIRNREVFLHKHSLGTSQATRLNPNMLQRATIDHETDYCLYVQVTDEDKGAGMSGEPVFVADAIVTTDAGHVLFLPIADCVGAVFFDAEHQVLMVAHLGRHSLEQQGARTCVEYLRDHYKTNPRSLKIWLSPAPSKELYPIWALDNKGMKEVTFEQLHDVGVAKENIIDNPAETDKDQNYYSYSEFLKGNRDEDGDYAILAVMN